MCVGVWVFVCVYLLVNEVFFLSGDGGLLLMSINVIVVRMDVDVLLKLFFSINCFNDHNTWKCHESLILFSSVVVVCIFI